MTRLILMALVSGFLGVALMVSAQATSWPQTPVIEGGQPGLDQLAQSKDVPKACQGIEDPVKLKQCIDKNQRGR